MPRLDKSIEANTVSGISSCTLMLVLGVLVITGDHLGVICLLKGYAGLVLICRSVSVEVTGVCDVGGLSSSALLLEVVSVFGLGSEPEFSVALILQQLDSP